MLTALHGEERLVGPRTDAARARSLARAGALSCPFCREPVTFRAGERRIAHFAHRPGARCPVEADPDYAPEGEPHLLWKLAVHDLAAQTLAGARVELEAVVPETGQRADVLVRLPGGERAAIEVQATDIAGAAWRRRHESYRRAGIADVWLLVGRPPAAASIPASPRRGVGASLRLELRDLAATVLHATGSLLVGWLPRESSRDDLRGVVERELPGSATAQGPVVAAVLALAAHHGVDPGGGRRLPGAGGEAAPAFAARPFRTGLALGGRYVVAGALDRCRFAIGGGEADLWVDERHERLARAAREREAAARARSTPAP